MAEPTAGVPCELLLPSDYITVRLGLVDAVGLDAAMLLERIRWRGEIREGGWVATYADLGEETRLSHRRVKAAVAVLRERGWLTSENAGEGTRTLRWQVVIDPSGRNVPMGDPSGRSVPTKGPKRPVAPIEDVGIQLPPSRPPSPDEGLFGDPEPAATPLRVVPDDIDGEFADFWALYPNKSSGPKPALAAYRKARRTATRTAITDGLTAHLPVYRALVAAGKRGSIPYATSWLNQARWQAEPPAMPRAPRGGNPWATPSAAGQ